MNLIHVIIPVYNAVQYLKETVASVLCQPYKGIDIVLVDDGSTDGSAALCDELAAQEIRIVAIHQKNAGVSAARNAGIEYFLQVGSDEAYIAFLDADDLWIPNTITADLVSRLPAGPSMAALGSSACTQNRQRFSSPIRYTPACKPGNASTIWQVRGHFCANLYSVELLRKWNLRFQSGLAYCEDKIFKMQSTFLSDQILFMPETLHIYRDNDGSAMKRAQQISAIEYYRPIIEGWIQSDAYVNSLTALSGKPLRSGQILAGIYLVDMALDHYKQWGSKKTITHILRNHPHRDLMLSFNVPDVQPYQAQKRDLLVHHPLLFKIKYNLLGAAEWAARKLLKLKPLQNCWMQRKYPLTQMPTNND